MTRALSSAAVARCGTTRGSVGAELELGSPDAEERTSAASIRASAASALPVRPPAGTFGWTNAGALVNDELMCSGCAFSHRSSARQSHMRPGRPTIDAASANGPGGRWSPAATKQRGTKVLCTSPVESGLISKK